MKDKILENLITKSFEEVPGMILSKIKKELANDVALQLIEKLERQKDPKKRESIDRINEYTESFLEGNNLIKRGA